MVEAAAAVAAAAAAEAQSVGSLMRCGRFGRILYWMRALGWGMGVSVLLALSCSAAGDDGKTAGPPSYGGGSGSSGTGGSGGGISLDGGGAQSAGGSGATGTGGGGNQAGCQTDGGGGVGAGGSGTGGPEQCGNGLDDNLNGFVDEGCSCTSGTTQSCYLGPPTAAGIGKCVTGNQTCIAQGEFPQWGPCTGSITPTIETCEGSVDEDCDGQIDESCGCCEGDVQPCGSQDGVCVPGSQTCVGGVWGDCLGGVQPNPEVCGNGLDDDCNGQVDDGCTLNIPVNIDGDCVTASCPPQAPYAIGCQITMSGNDPRGCVANNGSSVVYFQEGDKCGAGHVSGTLLCSSQPGSPLDANNCPINKSTKYYPSDKSGCPAT